MNKNYQPSKNSNNYIFFLACLIGSASLTSCALIAPSFNNSDRTSLLNSFIFDDSLSFVTLLLKLESFSEAKFFTAIEGSVIKRLMKNKFLKKILASNFSC